MADFVAVIRRAVDGLADNTPDNRERVYAKARGAVRRQLENMSPRPSDEVFRKQLERLEAAIHEVEIEHTEALPAEEGGADEARQLPENEGAEETRHQETFEMEAPRSRLFTAPIVEDRVESSGDAAGKLAASPPDGDERGAGPAGLMPQYREDRGGEETISPFSDQPLIGEAHDELFGLGSAAGAGRRTRRTSGRQLAILGVLLLLVAGAAYAMWDNRASVLPMIASLSSSSGPGKPSAAAKAPAQATEPRGKKQAAAPLPADVGNGGNSPAASDRSKAELPPGGKYTQRLMPDGTETNPGPASGSDEVTHGEGRSVSLQTAEASTAPASGGQQQNAADASPPAGDAARPAEISQKMYLYEERYKDQAPSAVTGGVVWSLAKDTSDGPGSNIPVIHGEISVPDKGITALVTIKRNNDPSLPASHLIEVVFALPGNFEGGGIQGVERVSLKETEQAKGDPLIAVPAKITDNFFMIALNDYPQAVKTNLDLLKTRNWIDIPLTYANGRRALITLAKGSSGAEVFDKALAAWSQVDNKVTDNNPTGAAGQSGPVQSPSEAVDKAPARAPTAAPNKPAPHAQ